MQVRSPRMKRERENRNYDNPQKIQKARQHEPGKKLLQSLVDRFKRRRYVFVLSRRPSLRYLHVASCRIRREFDKMSVSETILRRQWPIFLEYLDVDAISPILISKYVLPVDWMDNGEKPLRAREKREAILRIVRAKGRTGFQAFRKALAQVGQSHLVSSHALDALPSQKACLPLADDDAGVAAFMKGCSTTLKSPGTRRGRGTFGLSRLSSSSSF
ncbi:unnamed protein product [Darwinula stevensoni]|uniref:CARD domain-containing protein n=1 Tax=Darwinula stevensoni TaxID=69355 RepID=A0A7R9AFZ2_9CRUS|nr:unnamed protein product [Darwinula stevensoni]CAG0902873.1 unnamed protein product [Darwinula stevensoni]